MTMPRRIEIVEVGPRDGLQSEPDVLATPVKLELIRRLVDAGVRRVEVASFVNPKRVPQMADAEAVLNALAPMKTRAAIKSSKLGAAMQRTAATT